MRQRAGSDPVVLRTSVWSSVLLLALGGFLTWSHGGYLMDGPSGSVLGWAFALLFLGVFALMALAGLAGLRRRWSGRGNGVALTPGGPVLADGTQVPVASLTSIRWHPAERTTWTGPERPGAPRVLSRSRLEGRLDVGLPGQILALTPSEPAWPEALAAIHGWVRERPVLSDQPTRDFLAGAAALGPPPAAAPPGVTTTRVAGRRRHRWLPVFGLLWAACAVAAWVWWPGPRSPAVLLQAPLSGLMLAGVIWFPLSTTVPVVRGVGSALRGDPWRMFSAAPDGRYPWLVSGRMSLLRAPRSGGTVAGLVLRWLAVLYLWAMTWVPLVLLVQLGLILWRLRRQMEGLAP